MKCLFNIQQDEIMAETFEWFKSVGINWIKSYADLHFDTTVEVEFIDTPSILNFFSYLESVSICKITQQGISFYLTQIPLEPLINDGGQAFISDISDGVAFCPMSNVKMISTFGVKPKC